MSRDAKLLEHEFDDSRRIESRVNDVDLTDVDDSDYEYDDIDYDYVLDAEMGTEVNGGERGNAACSRRICIFAANWQRRAHQRCQAPCSAAFPRESKRNTATKAVECKYVCN